MAGTARDFRLFWLAGAADQLGTQATGLVMPLLVLAVGGGPVEAGLVGTLAAAARFCTEPLAGVYADRFSRLRQLTAAALISAAAMAFIAAAVATDTATWPLLLGASLVQGVAAGWYSAAGSGALRRVIPPDRPEKAIAALRARGQAADLAGPSVGGALYQVAPVVPFIFDAVSYVVSAVLIRLVRTDLGPDRAEGQAAPPSVRADLVAGLRFVFGHPFLRFVVLWAAGVNLALGAVYFHVVLLARLAGASAASIGLILTISGAAGLAGSLAAPWIIARVSTVRLVIGTSWLLVGVVTALALVHSTWQYGLVLSVVAVVSPALSVVLSTRAIMIIPDAMQGRAGTVLGTISEGAGSFAPLIAGVLIATVSPTVVAFAFGVGLAALAWYTTANRRHVADSPAAEESSTKAGV